MRHADARALAHHITATAGCACTVPNGHGPDGYVARIRTSRNDEGVTDWEHLTTRAKDFHSRAEWDAWWELCERERVRQLALSRPRSPLDVLIDRAVGIEEAPDGRSRRPRRRPRMTTTSCGPIRPT